MIINNTTIKTISGIFKDDFICYTCCLVCLHPVNAVFSTQPKLYKTLEVFLVPSCKINTSAFFQSLLSWRLFSPPRVNFTNILHSFYIRKFCAQLFCAYFIDLYFTGARLLAQKLCVERWWNWTHISSQQMLELEKSIWEEKICQQFKPTTTTTTTTAMTVKGLIREDVTTTVQLLPLNVLDVLLLLPLQQQQHRIQEIAEIVSFLLKSIGF